MTITKEVITMEIQNTNDISYNLGRLLAVADAIESTVLYLTNDDKSKGIRATNAMRYFNRFTRMPCKTWRKIKESNIYYLIKLNKLNQSTSKYLSDLLAEISAQIDLEEFYKAKNLDGRMALGFDSQRNAIIGRNNAMRKAKKNKEEK